MAEIYECGVCNNIYDELDRKPLVLLCGHTYCQPCLQGIVSQGSTACPYCRKAIVSQVTELPVNFMLIPPSSSGEAASKSLPDEEMFCSTHQNELYFWCTDCKILICKQCLVEAHADHKFTVTERIFADKKILSDVKSQINANLHQTEFSLRTLEQLKLLSSKLDDLKSSFPMWKESLTQQRSSLAECSGVLKKISSKPSFKQKKNVLKILKSRNNMLNDVDVNDVFKQVYNLVSEYQVSNFPDESSVKLLEIYLPDGQQWDIICSKSAEKALRTMKVTDHKTPKAVVKSTDESPIMCLFKLLQYLATTSASMELELMDTSERKYPDKNNWFPLKAGGEKSTNFKRW